MTDALVDPCPLCGERNAGQVLTIPYAAIWQGLREEWAAELPEDVIRRHQPGPEAALHECRRCGLQFFTPLVPGDAAFYGRLMAGMPYLEDRWEFGLVRSRLSSGDRVVDLGCGDGAFLRLASGMAGRVVGVDHNAQAVERLTVLGIEAHAVGFEEFAARETGAFEVACSFHTLEHLPSVGPLVRAAAAVVRGGGRVFLSVPNRERYGRSELEPLDCPPHHVSRWSEAQLEALAGRFGLEIVSVRFEEPDYSHVWEWHRRRLHPALAKLGAGDERHPVHRAAMKAAVGPRRYRRAATSGRYTARGMSGHSMLAEYRVP